MILPITNHDLETMLEFIALKQMDVMILRYSKYHKYTAIKCVECYKK